MKDRVYIETSVVSYLTGRGNADTIVAAHQELTRRWWDDRSSHYEMLISQLVHREAAAGDSTAANARLEAVAELQMLAVTDEAISLAEQLVDGGLVMYTDPVVEEVRRVRQEYAKRFDYDLRAIGADLRQQEQEHQHRLVSFPPKRLPKKRTA